MARKTGCIFFLTFYTWSRFFFLLCVGPMYLKTCVKLEGNETDIQLSVVQPIDRGDTEVSSFPSFFVGRC